VAGKQRPRFLWLASCAHIGEESHDAKLFAQYLAWAKRHNADIVVMGDLLDTGLCIGTKHIGSVWENDLTPDEQIDRACSLLGPLKRQIIGVVTGNHELRIERVTSINPLKQVALRLGVDYSGPSKVLRWNKWTLFCAHGTSGNLTSDFKKVLDGWEGVSVIALAHVHYLMTQTIVRFVVEEGSAIVRSRKIHLIRTGNFLKYAKYAALALHSPTDVGSAILEDNGSGNLKIHLGLP